MISDSSGLFITLHSMLATVFHQATILRPMHPRVTEGKNLTLTCINNIPDTYSSWETSFDTQRFLLSVSGTNGECTHINVPIYIYSYCSVNQFNVTILKVQNIMHGSTWKCSHAGDSSESVELFVEVPVKSVNMSINNKAANGVLNCVENETLSLECTTSFGRPKPNITWYTGNSYGNASDEISTTSQLLVDDAYDYRRSRVTLSVSRSYNGKGIFCTSSNLKDVTPVFSDYSKLNVQYPPALGQIKNMSVIEMRTVNFSCPVMQGNPAETQFTWTRNEDNNIVQNETFLIEHVLRKDRGYYSFMARNTMELSNGTNVYGHSRSTLYLEVLYPPEEFQVTCLTGSLRYESFNEIISVIEDVSVTLICSAKGNPYPSSYSWSGNVSANQANLTFIVNQNHSGDYMCRANNTMKEIPGNTTIGTNNKTYTLAVMFPPEILEVQNITVIEAKPVVFKYRVKPGNPQVMQFKWTRNVDNQVWDYEPFSIASVHRNDESEYTLSVSNTMKPTCGTEGFGNRTKIMSLEVLFSPDILEVQNITLIEGKTVEIKAQVVKGNPQETHFRWTRIKDNYVWNNEAVSILTVRRDDESEYKLSVNNTLKPTCGKEAYGYKNKNMRLIVLYPPEGMRVACLTDSSLNETIVDVFNITEGTNLTLACSAIGNPSPSSYFWSGKMYVSQAKLTFYVTRNHSGDYNCTASNTMKEIPGTTRNGTISKKYSMKVLYAPEVKKMQNITAIEGEHFKFDCPVIFGYPSETTFRWLRMSDNSVWNSQTLSINNITRYDGKTYTCEVNNTLHPTYGIETIGAHSQNVNIEILYKANISGFTIEGHNTNNNVTVNESDTVTFICSVDSNPGSFMKITLEEKLLEEMNGTKQLKHRIVKTKCTDWGTYYCHAHNQYNSQHNIPRTYITMYVNCAPRQLATIYPAQNVTNVTSGQHVSITLTFKALAYPIPTVHWERKINSSWIELGQDSSNKTLISSSAQDLQYNLTVFNISELDYGQYRLNLANSFGQHIQLFNFIPNVAQPLKTDSNVSVVGPAVGGAFGVLLIVGAFIFSMVYFRKRRSVKRPDAPVYQNMKTQDGQCLSSLDSGPSDTYEKLHNRDSRSDQQYQQLSSFAREGRTGQLKIYENLRLTHEENKTKSYDIQDRASPDKQTQSTI